MRCYLHVPVMVSEPRMSSGVCFCTGDRDRDSMATTLSAGVDEMGALAGNIKQAGTPAQPDRNLNNRTLF